MECADPKYQCSVFLRASATAKGPVMSREVAHRRFSLMARTGAASWRKMARKFAIVPLVTIGVASLVSTGEADPGLTGSWSGGGWLSLASGAREKARCRARYSKASSNSYRLRATCATSGGRASQTATVYRLSSGRYRGTFYNSDYNISGTIRVVVRGRSQSVSLAGNGASASLRLRKR